MTPARRRAGVWCPGARKRTRRAIGVDDASCTRRRGGVRQSPGDPSAVHEPRRIAVSAMVTPTRGTTTVGGPRSNRVGPEGQPSGELRRPPVRAASASFTNLRPMTTDAPAAAPAKEERWTYQWKELYSEVITSGLCTGLRRLRHLVPPRRDRLRPRRRAATSRSTSRRSSASTTASTARRAARQLHPGLPPVPALGAQGRRAPLRPDRADDEIAGDRPATSC